MKIDANIYWFPESLFEDEKQMEAFVECAPKEFNVHIRMEQGIEEDTTQFVIEQPKGYPNLNYIQGQYHLKNMLEDMDKAGIDKGILKVPGCHEWLSLEFCRYFNDGMAEYVRQSEGRLEFMAVVPPWGTQECIDELSRSVDELGACGIQMSAHYGDKYLDHSDFEKHFSWINARSLPVYVHHTPLPVEHSMLLEFNNLRRSYGRSNDQMIAIGREIFSGFFEKYPNIRLVHSMLGGGFFAYKDLLVPRKSPSKDAAIRFVVDNEAVLRYLKENIFFEMSHAAPWGQAQLECAVKVLGADHIIFGSSYPVVKGWQLGGVAFVENLEITDEDKKMLLSGTAQDVYGGTVYAKK